MWIALSSDWSTRGSNPTRIRGEPLRIVRYLQKDRTGYGVYRDGFVVPVAGNPYKGIVEDGEPVDMAEVRLLAPALPSKIVAAGLNYSDHAEEFGMDITEEPIIFLKAPSTVVGPHGEVICPPQSHRVDYEVELAVVIGRESYLLDEKESLSHVLGYTCGLDMTARDLQLVDGQWTRAKNFDTFCPLGPWIETGIDPGDLAIELRLNGELKQSSRTSRMIFPISRLVSFITSIMTLFPGDVIMTGTPPGVGEVHPGDRLEAAIEGIGDLVCTVVGQPRSE